MIRRAWLIALVILIAAAAAACGAPAAIEIETPDGSTVSVETEGMSDQQIKALRDYSDGSTDMRELLQSGLFAPGELMDMGLPGSRISRTSWRTIWTR